MPLHREPDYQLFEYACHEGNRAVPNTLSGGARETGGRAGVELTRGDLRCRTG
jgi:hypothetical protein